MKNLEMAIVTGLSGSGKSIALHALEDAGYYCVDNIPVRLVTTLCEWAQGGHEINRVGLVMDTRDPDVPNMLPEVVESLRAHGVRLRVLFLDCNDDVLIRRFSETRRVHHMAKATDLADGIRLERSALAALPELADIVLDTSAMTGADLREAVGRAFSDIDYKRRLNVTVTSFGFKWGVPSEADLVIDVRFIPNPFYVTELRSLTGLDQEVGRWMLAAEPTREFLDKIDDLMRFLLPRYQKEGKSYLTIAVGCTGGRHRSVFLAGEIAQRLSGFDFDIQVKHRDLHR